MKIKAKIQSGDSLIILNLRGRLAWTLSELVKAGHNGITPLHNPAPRVSHYVMTYVVRAWPLIPICSRTVARFRVNMVFIV